MNYVTHVFHEIFLHLNWHCYGSQPMIGREMEDILHRFLRDYCCKTKGVFSHGIGGTETHIHLVIQLEPFVNISDLVHKLKGASAHEMNSHFGKNALRWQRGYGVASFARKNLAAVLSYVEKQREHHSRGTTRKILEQCGPILRGAGQRQA